MFYITKSGRVVNNLQFVEGEEYITSETYPEAPHIKGKISFVTGFNGSEILFGYADAVKTDDYELPQPEPTPQPLSPTEQAIMQTAINTEYVASLMEIKG